MKKFYNIFLLLLLTFYSVYSQKTTDWTYIVNDSKKYSFKIEAKLLQQNSPNICGKQKWFYKLKKTGSNRNNTLIKWEYHYNKNCPSSKNYIPNFIQEINFRIPKGENKYSDSIILDNVSSLNIQLLLNSKPIIINYQDPPTNFSIKGSTNQVWQGDLVSMEVSSTDDFPILVWEWYKDNKGKKEFLGTGNILKDYPITNTKYFLCSNIGGFKSSFKEFNVLVKSRPDPPSNFTLFGPNTMTDIETNSIVISPNTTLDNVKWLWYKGMDTKPFFEGDILIIDNPMKLLNPNTNNINLRVQSEYYGKRSPLKNYDIKVNILPEPPSNFKIILPVQVNDNDLVWLKVNTPKKIDNVKWIWSGPYIIKTQNDSILVKPEETASYELKANLNGKISKGIISKLIVNQKAAIPKIDGIFSKCQDDLIGKKYTIIGGKLGTKSKNWVWYEKTNYLPIKLGIGKEIVLNPKKTTNYFVRPENDNKTIKEFEIIVHELPNLPFDINIKNNACLNNFIQLYPSNFKNDLKYIWKIENVNNNLDKYNLINDTLGFILNQDKIVWLKVKDEYCFSSTSIQKIIKINSISTLPYQIFLNGEVKYNKLNTIMIYGGNLSDKSNWVWYDKDHNLIERTKSNSILYKFTKKSNELLLRSEGPCDTSEFKFFTLEKKNLPTIVYKNNFFSIGTFANDNFNSNNLMLTLGIKKMYFRFKTNYKFLMNKSSYDNLFNGQELKNNGSIIYNYPSNSNSFYTFTQDFINSRMSFTTGFIFGNKSTKIFFGGGYGIRDLYWKVNIFDYTNKNLLVSKWTNNTSYSYRGGELESGLFVNIGRITFMSGASAIFNESKSIFIDGNFGIGFNW